MRRTFVRVVLLGVFVPVALSAQSSSSDAPQVDGSEQAVFRSEANLVVLHVNVFDRRSDAVPELPQTAFEVLEDGAPQKITFFSSADVPVAVGLIIDNSSSMLTRRSMVLAGAAAFVDSSHPEDEVFTIVFNEHVRDGLPDTVLFTQNKVLLQTTLTRFPAGGKTAVHDAVVAGLEHLEEATHQKHVLVVLSDGEDNASRLSDDDMLQRAARSDALIYTVSTADLGSDPGNRGLLRRLADTSGGVAYFPRSEREVIEAFKEIAENIRRGYSIGYVPTNTTHDGKYRRVVVTARMPGRSKLSVRARDGYLAPRHDDTH